MLLRLLNHVRKMYHVSEYQNQHFIFIIKPVFMYFLISLNFPTTGHKYLLYFTLHFKAIGKKLISTPVSDILETITGVQGT